MTRVQQTICLLLTLALLMAWPVAMSPVLGPAVPALADDGETEEEDDEDDEDDDEDDEKEEDKDDKDKEKDDDEGNGEGNRRNAEGRGGPVAPTKPYRVDVACTYDDDADQTACTFTGVAPPGAKDVGQVDLPASDVCAEVVGGDAEYVDPDPNTRVVGYTSRGSEGAFTLVLAGEVTDGGTATYWFETGDGVFPATGPGLVCDGTTGQPEAVGESTREADDGIRVTGELVPTPTAAAPDDAGLVIVLAYSCATKPADPAAFDWYGECEPGGQDVPFSLTATDAAAASEASTDEAGMARFDGLAPGTYSLDAPDVVWCHAESDAVDEQGDLAVEAGAEVSVWIFLCATEDVK